MKAREAAKKFVKLTAGVLIAAMTFTACSTKDNETTTTKETETTQLETTVPESEESLSSRVQDDFYEAINGEWIASAKIPADEIMVGGFMDISTEIEETLIADLDKMLGEGKDEQEDEMGQMLTYYKMALDIEHRNEEGAAPILGTLEKIYAIDSLEEFNANAADYTLSAWALPFNATVMADMGDATQNAVYLVPPSLGLADKTYYEEGNQTGAQLLPVYEQMLTDLFVLTGKSQEEAAEIASDTIAFEKLIAPYTKSRQESSVIKDLYNPVSLEELSTYSTHVDLNSYVTNLIGAEPEHVVLTDLNYFNHLDSIVNEETFPMIKNYMAAKWLESASAYLSEDFREAGSTITMLMSGQMELSDVKTSAYYNSTSVFGSVLGDYYGRTYFGEEAKADVIQMVDKMVAVYKERLVNNDWLSHTTKEKAIKKLDTMSVKIGYPDEIPEIYSNFKVIAYEDGGSYYSNLENFSVIAMKDVFSKYKEPVDTSRWNLTAHTVNAMYNVTDNSICFPAAILQAPFYDIDSSSSENYGGIGAVIAHEITHAFDNNGAQYDELGNLNDWWTEEDYVKFEEKTNKMVELFDGVEFAGGTVDGLLTVTENVADAGGVSCALEIVKSLPDSDLEEFFTSYATIWRMKTTSQYEQLLLSLDVHAPNKLRTNLQVANFEEFYTTFDVKEGDGMYIAPDDRVSVW